MASILSDEAAAFAADPEFVDKADGYIVDAEDWNELLAAHRDVNSFLHGGAVPANLRIATCRVGDSSSTGATLELGKTDVGVANVDWRSAGVLRWRLAHTSGEALALERYDSSGVLASTPVTFAVTGAATFTHLVTCTSGLTVSTGNQIISSGNLTLSAASAFISLGDAASSGNAQIRFLKGAANNQSIFSIQSDAVAQWIVQHDTTENLNFQRSVSGDTPLRLRQSDGALCSFVQNALVELGTTAQGAIVITTPTVGAGTGSSITMRGGQGGSLAGGVSQCIGGQGAANSGGGRGELRGGPGGATSGAGGDAWMIGGVPVDGNGGGVFIGGGNAATTTAANRDGGGVTVRTGVPVNNGNAGDFVVLLDAATGSGTNGTMQIRPRSTTTNQTTFLADGGVQFGGSAGGWRSLGANVALTLAQRDRNIELNSTDAAAKAATMTATYAGHVVRVVLTAYSSTGSYTLACTRGATAGTVTLNAVGEGCLLVYSGSAWKLFELIGGATFA